MFAPELEVLAQDVLKRKYWVIIFATWLILLGFVCVSRSFNT